MSHGADTYPAVNFFGAVVNTVKPDTAGMSSEMLVL